MKLDKKKIISISLFILILIYSSIKILTKTIGNMDEIWSYNFANQISRSLLPYKDFNIITTPLLPFIAGLFLKVYNSLFTMRILSIIVSTSSMFLVYKILDKLNIKLSVLLTILISIFYFNYYYLEYNNLCLLLNLFIIYLELLLKDSNKKHLFIGILAGLVFLSKQTVGLLTSLAIMLYQIIINYKNKKVLNSNLLFRLIGIMIPTVLFIIYLLFNNIVSEFIDYTILGISTFSNKIGYLNLITGGNIIIKILAIIIPLSYLFMLYTYIKKKDNKILIIGGLSIAMFSLVYPISDVTHFCVAIIVNLIANIYTLSLYIKLNNKNMIKYSSLISMVILLGLSGYTYIRNNNQYKSTLNHFKGLPISKSLEDEIIDIDNYIKNNNNVYILDSKAALYMISIDRYNKNYDLFMNGNFGKDGINSMLNNIKEDNNSIYLINNKKKNWQTPLEITDYIENNFNKIDEIYNYNIYKK